MKKILCCLYLKNEVSTLKHSPYSGEQKKEVSDSLPLTSKEKEYHLKVSGNKKILLSVSSSEVLKREKPEHWSLTPK